jgi:hypothetical protein
MVLLYTGKGRSAAVNYRLPNPDKALTPSAVNFIRRRVRSSLLPGTACPQGPGAT